MNKDTGGAAFPTDYAIHSGMTLRDYFAAKAMQGELAAQTDSHQWNDIGKLTEYAYQIADAMLEARSK